jgi:hypothetical protein
MIQKSTKPSLNKYFTVFTLDFFKLKELRKCISFVEMPLKAQCVNAAVMQLENILLVNSLRPMHIRPR